MESYTYFSEILSKQECIPVGCIPSAAVAIGRGVCLGSCLPGSVCPGGFLPGVSAWGCLSAQRGVCPGGVSAPVHAGIPPL